MTSPSEVQVRATLEDELTGPLTDLRRDVKRLGGDVEDAGKRANRGARGFDVMAGSAVRLGRAAGGIALKGVAAGLGIVSVAAVATGAKLVGLAMDAAETASKFGTVFAGVPGDVGGYLDDLSSRFGLVTKDLQDAAANFGVFGKAAGIPKDALGAFSKDLVGAGTDLASFYNADPTEVFQALRSGLSGEAEPLRQFGIFLSDAAMKAEAATMGLTGELTESQKVMVRQRIIMASLGDAQGDLQRTSGGLSNQWKALKGNLTNAGTAIGTALLPYATQLVTWANGQLGPATDRLNAKLPVLTGYLEGLGGKAASVYAAFQVGGLDSAVGQFDAISGSSVSLRDALELAKPIVDDLSTVLNDVLAPALGTVSGAIDPAWLTPLGLARAALGFVADHSEVFADILPVVVIGLAAAKTATMLLAAKVWLLNAATAANPVGLLVLGLGLLVGGLVLAWRHSETFRGIVIGVFTAVGKAILSGVDLWLAALGGVFSIAEKIPGPVGDAARAAGAAVDRARDKVAALKGGLDVLNGTHARPTVSINSSAAEEELIRLERRITNVGGVQVAVPTSNVATALRVGGSQEFGDTVTSKARGGGIASTLASHASIVGAAGVSPRIANAFVGGGGHGRGSGDHQRGQALDLVGPGLGAYARETRRQGGYAAFHGSGRTRHLHAVPAPIGDTRTSMAARVASRSSSSSGTAAPTVAPRVLIGPGAIVVQGLTAEEAADVVAAGIDAYVRNAEERS